jgi:hypothetical protein
MKHLTSYLASWSTLFAPLLVAPFHDTSPAAAFENSDNDTLEPVRDLRVIIVYIVKLKERHLFLRGHHGETRTTEVTKNLGTSFPC